MIKEINFITMGFQCAELAISEGSFSWSYFEKYNKSKEESTYGVNRLPALKNFLGLQERNVSLIMTYDNIVIIKIKQDREVERFIRKLFPEIIQTHFTIEANRQALCITDGNYRMNNIPGENDIYAPRIKKLLEFMNMSEFNVVKLYLNKSFYTSICSFYIEEKT